MMLSERENDQQHEGDSPADGTDHRQPQGPTFLRRAVRNFLFSGLGTVSNFVIAFLFAGLTIRFLGESRAGFLMALGALVGFGSLLGDFGLGTPAIRRIAALNAQQDFQTARLVVGSVSVASLVSGFIIGFPIVFFFPSVFSWSRLEIGFQQDAFSATAITVVTYLLSQSTLPWRSTYSALERFGLQSGLNSVFGILSGVAGILTLRFFPIMTALALTRLLISLLRSTVDAMYMHRLLKGVPWPMWSWKEIKPMLGFGGWVYFSTVGTFLMGRASSLILTTFLGSAALPYYEFPQRIYGQVHTVLDSQSRFLFPMFSSFGESAIAEIKRVADRIQWLIALASGIVYTTIGLIGVSIFSKVVSSDFGEKATYPLIFASIQGFFESLAIFPYYASWAVGTGKPNAVKELIQGALVILTAFVLIPRLGVIGASLSQLWNIPVVLIHLLWVKHLITPNSSPWLWMRAWLSPFIMIIAWIMIVLIISTSLQHDSVLYFSIVALGAALGFLAMWVTERRIFNKDRREETLMRLAKESVRYLRRG